jgi:hypothetical protein
MTTMDARLTSAVQCLQDGRLAEAARLCRAILAAAPNDVPATHLLGFIAYKAGAAFRCRRRSRNFSSRIG